MHNRISHILRPFLTLSVLAAVAASPIPTSAYSVEELVPTINELLAPRFEGRLTLSLSPYQSLPNSHPDYEDRYQAWAQAHPDHTPEQVVLNVNIGLDRDFYQDTDLINQPDSLSVLVNKYNTLPADYVPTLEALGASYGSGSLRPEAAAAFRAMADAARADGIALRSVSAYRSYQSQDRVYSRYLTQDSQASVDTYSARPGSSEHQTALALDINTASLQAHFENTDAYAWLVEHCAEYGFILRYPQGKENITGYRFEPWHYRYVGTEIAQVCMDQDLTLEEYMALQPVDKTSQISGPIQGLPFV